jgi:putative ABC transport system permease protein
VSWLVLASRSLRSRLFAVMLTLLTIALSVALLIGVQQLREDARRSFLRTISGTDLIVGARSGSVNLLLYAVFRIGDATNNMSYQSYQNIIAQPQVAWSIPISLGDAHQGFRVVGTTNDYFTYLQYGEKRHLQFEVGALFANEFDAVIGADVAEKLHYQLGDEIVLGHGTGRVSFHLHTGNPFRIVGILQRTGTPVDQSVHVSLPALSHIHQEFAEHAHLAGSPTATNDPALTSITALYLGLHSRAQAFALQRLINNDDREPLSAIMPGLTLQQLWSMLNIVERVLMLISTLVLLAAMTGMLSSIWSTLEQRRREMAVLRAIGARPAHIFGMLILESTLLTVGGIALGILLLVIFQLAAAGYIQNRFGWSLHLLNFSANGFRWLMIIALLGICLGAVPAMAAFRRTLADGLSLRN